MAADEEQHFLINLLRQEEAAERDRETQAERAAYRVSLTAGIRFVRLRRHKDGQCSSSTTVLIRLHGIIDVLHAGAHQARDDCSQQEANRDESTAAG